MLEFERDLYKMVPEKVDIGAIYNLKPQSDRRKKDLTPVERDLVFDIDLTDYDDVRTCCSGAGICKKCWQFMVVAILIVDRALDEDFGFDERLWIFSGRRGVHCWVSDERARKLSNNSRVALIDYLSVAVGGERTKSVELKGRTIHSSIHRACSILERYFPKMVAHQGWLGSEEQQKRMLALIPDPDLRSHIETTLQECETPIQKWQCFTKAKREVEIPANSLNFVEEIMLQYAYPRLDANVTKSMNHLLKSPFCVHAKTGKVCVILNPAEDRLITFDPENVPTLDLLHTELAAFDKQQSAVEAVDQEASNNRKILDYKRTSLKPYIEEFREYVEKLQTAKVEKTESMDF